MVFSQISAFKEMLVVADNTFSVILFHRRKAEGKKQVRYVFILEWGRMWFLVVLNKTDAHCHSAPCRYGTTPRLSSSLCSRRRLVLFGALNPNPSGVTCCVKTWLSTVYKVYASCLGDHVTVSLISIKMLNNAGMLNGLSWHYSIVATNYAD